MALDEWTRVKYGPAVMGKVVDYSQPWWQTSIFFKDLQNLIEIEVLSVLQDMYLWLQSENAWDPMADTHILDSRGGGQHIMRRALSNVDTWGLFRQSDTDLLFLVGPQERITRSGAEIREDAKEQLLARTRGVITEEFTTSA